MFRYRLRTLLIVLAVVPPLAAATWFASTIEWSDEILLIVAVACAIPYWIGIAILLAWNPRQLSAWIVAIAAAMLWFPLFFSSLMQLVFVIPVWSVLCTHGSDLGKPLPLKSVLLALGLTVAFFVWIAAVVVIHD